MNTNIKTYTMLTLTWVLVLVAYIVAQNKHYAFMLGFITGAYLAIALIHYTYHRQVRKQQGEP